MRGEQRKRSQRKTISTTMGAGLRKVAKEQAEASEQDGNSHSQEGHTVDLTVTSPADRR
jgi:hypothetical protein